MSVDQQIADLEVLVALDAEIKALHDSLERERADIETVRKEVAGLEERLTADRNAAGEMDKTRNDLMQELRQIGTQLERSRERLSRSRNEREQQAAERELDELRKLQRDRDDEIKRLVELSDQARGTITQNEQRVAELSERLAGSLEGSTKTISELEGQMNGKVQERTAVATRLPSLTRRRYQSMHERGKVPVAKTHDGTCLGCYVGLPPMMFHRMLSRTQFEECPNCHRIIYYTPPPAEGASEEEGGRKRSSAEEASS